MTDTEAPAAAPLFGGIPAFGAAQRAIESIVIALITSTGLYLVGSVYVEAYYRRMSIDPTSLDLAPPYIALQSAHVVQSLIEYPLTVLLFYAIYRLLAARIERLRLWYDRGHNRFGRLFLLIVNLIIVSPLIIAAARVSFEQGIYFASTLLGEVAELMTTFGGLLVVYVIWLSVSPRSMILIEIRKRKLIPIVLLFALYLLDALVATARGATLDAEVLMMGAAESSIEISFSLAADANTALPDTSLILVAARTDIYYVVERQEYPPSRQPVAYMVPFGAVDSARLQRVNPANPQLEDLFIEEGIFATPEAP